MTAICIKDCKVVGLSVFTFEKGVKYELIHRRLINGYPDQFEYFYYEGDGNSTIVSIDNFNEYFMTIDEYRDSIINKIIT